MKKIMFKFVIAGFCLMQLVSCANEKRKTPGSSSFTGQQPVLTCSAPSPSTSLTKVSFYQSQNGFTAVVDAEGIVGPPAPMTCIDMTNPNVQGSDFVLQCDDYNDLVELRGTLDHYYVNLYNVSTGSYQLIEQLFCQ